MLYPVGFVTELGPVLPQLLLSFCFLSLQLQFVPHLELLVERDALLLDRWPLLHFVKSLRSCLPVSELVVGLRLIEHVLVFVF